MPYFEIDSYVMCGDGKGFVMDKGAVQKFPSNFPKNSIGVVLDVGESQSTVYVIGQKADYVLPNGSLIAIDPMATGGDSGKKICNICHVLKKETEFAPNQTQKGGRVLRRPSCKICRMDIDNKPMTAAEKRAAEKLRPKDGTLFTCPICRKQTIVGVTAKIVLDHRHGDGSAREFICDSCNTGLGRFKNGENFLKNAIDYLERLHK